MSAVDNGWFDERQLSRPAASAPSRLPIDHPRQPDGCFAGGTIPLAVDHATADGLRRAARVAGGGLFHAIAAVHAWWLHLYADSTDVVFGTASAHRDREDRSDAALRCAVSGSESFTALVGRVRCVVAEQRAAVAPFDSPEDAGGGPGALGNGQLSHTMLVFRRPSDGAPAKRSLQGLNTDVRGGQALARCDVSVELEERADGRIVGELLFRTDLFDSETAHAMASHWCRLLAAVAADPRLPMGEHDVVTPEERQRQLSWNQTIAEPISSRCVHEVISSQVERTPDAVAVQVGEAEVTYRQLDDRAATIASRLQRAGAGPGTVVALLLDRTPDVVAAILGVLRSGAAFLPLDPHQPDSRNAFCINDVGAHIVLTDGKRRSLGDAIAANVVDIGALGHSAPNESARQALCRNVSPVDLAYVICTSGSTGRPKPVLIEHRGATNLMLTLSREFGIRAGDTVLSVAAISFDMALFDIFCALTCGARVVLASAGQALRPASLSGLIAETGATYMMATPTMWRTLMAAGWRGDRRLMAAAGGETLTDAVAQALLQRCGAVWNGYGPTETTAGTSVARLAEGDTVTVGKPLPNLRVYITDSRGRLLPIGVPGEIVIGGVGVGRGYLNRPEEQARRFGDDPFCADGRIYRTGDRGRFLPDGRIQHLGRYDDQLKIRGFRIEPGEIESTLSAHPEVSACAVVARDLFNGEKLLVAYIVSDPGRLSDDEARDWLRRRLPEYLIPGAFVHLGALPMTTSGKLDKAALPAPPSRRTGGAGGTSPRTDTERRVAAVWADLLGTPVTDIGSDFFDLGGHSLLAARLISGIEQTFGIELPLAAFLDSGRTIASLAAMLDAGNPRGTDEVTAEPPLHFIFSDRNSAMSMRHFTAQWGAALPVHPLIPEQPGGQFDRSVTIEELASQTLSAIRVRQPKGPLAIAGFSIGGLLAYEVARQAVDAGQRVDWLSILDAPAPSMAQPLRSHLTLRWRLRRIRKQPVRERWAKYQEVALRLLRSGELWPPQDFDYRGASEIACRYQQPGHNVPVRLFVTEGSAADAEAGLLGWDEFHHGSLTVHRLAAEHATMLDLPVVADVARTMRESLRHARALASAAPLSDSCQR